MLPFGDLAVVLEGPDQDISEVNFRFSSHLPNIPYGLFNFTNYTDTELGISSAHILANLNLQIDVWYCRLPSIRINRDYLWYLLSRTRPTAR